ncbi:MAG: ParA family protein [Thiohalophilus sp.]|uniref:ParA family protein n=1 Tax=Thiohalophilus sp. TaxID=3028392 RepID=UPI0028701491|nr:ParA family protein [Thiohalophilus sp.]MDR9435342.1 ParA family protein [Thiohalophilus sp.]
MRNIMVLNAKGGCGKSTIATNLASYYAYELEKQVTLADFDPQGSSLAWLKARPNNYPIIHGLDACRNPVRTPKQTEVVIMDAPARVQGPELTQLVRRVETIIVPVLPSPIDIRAAADFMRELLTTGKVSRNETRVAVVANRVRENTLIYQSLQAFLKSLKIPFVTTLRDTQNYIRAEERGVGIFEMAPSQVWWDLEQWEPLIRWLRSKRSQGV